MSLVTPGRNIVLFGMMGVGKTTVGQLVAEALNRTFVDTDEIVVRYADKTIPEIFADEGERGFRRRESEAVREVAALRGRVIAVGGGAVLDPANRTHLRGTGELVWLDASPAVLAHRLRQQEEVEGRPLLAGSDDLEGTLARIRDERLDAYQRAAHHRIDTEGRPPEVIADLVLDWARQQPGLLSREERGE